MTDNKVFEHARQYRRVDVADHEILLSFNSDDDAYDFYQWMNEVGEALFLEYLTKMKCGD